MAVLFDEIIEKVSFNEDSENLNLLFESGDCVSKKFSNGFTLRDYGISRYSKLQFLFRPETEMMK